MSNGNKWTRVATAALLTFSAFICACSSVESQADKLYEEGSYKEALELYESAEKKLDEKTLAKMDECRFNIFKDFVRENGEVTQKHSEVTGGNPAYETKIEVRDSGDIILTYREDPSSLQAHGVNNSGDMKVKIEIPFGSKEARVSGVFTMTTPSGVSSSLTLEQTADGVLDIGTYRRGDGVDWDSQTDETKSSNAFWGGSGIGVSMIDALAPSIIERMFDDLQTTMGRCGSGSTLGMIGFESIDKIGANTSRQ